MSSSLRLDGAGADAGVLATTKSDSRTRRAHDSNFSSRRSGLRKSPAIQTPRSSSELKSVAFHGPRSEPRTRDIDGSKLPVHLARDQHRNDGRYNVPHPSQSTRSVPEWPLLLRNVFKTAPVAREAMIAHPQTDAVRCHEWLDKQIHEHHKTEGANTHHNSGAGLKLHAWGS